MAIEQEDRPPVRRHRLAEPTASAPSRSAARAPAAPSTPDRAATQAASAARWAASGVVTAVFYAVLAVLALWAFRHMRALDPDSGPASTSSGERHDALARSDH
jgi:hypothetical protein